MKSLRVQIGQSISLIPTPDQSSVKGIILDAPSVFQIPVSLEDSIDVGEIPLRKDKYVYIDEIRHLKGDGYKQVNNAGWIRLKASLELLFDKNNDSWEVGISDDLFLHLLSANSRGRQYLNELDPLSQPVQKIRKSRVVLQRKDINQQQLFQEPHQPIEKKPDYFQQIYPMLVPPIRFDQKNSALLPYPLYKYQWQGVRKLVENPEFLLADEMGTGKTVMTCVALDVLFHKGEIKQVWIVSPVSVIRVWIDHLRDWCPNLRTVVVRGNSYDRRIAWSIPAQVYVVSYDSLRSDIETGNLRKGKYGVDLVVLDEAQAIKNEDSKRNRAMQKILSKKRWALTGTPIENKVDEPIAIFNFLKPKYFPKDAAKNMLESQIREMIAPYMLRRLKKDVMKYLPPKLRQMQWLELNEEQRIAYDEALYNQRKSLKELGGKITKIRIFAAIQTLKQICNFPPNSNHSPKIEALLDILSEVSNYETKIVVFSQYVVEGIDKIDRILKRRKDVEVIKGSIAPAQRDLAIESFKHNPEKKILLASLKTGGVGLTLTEASYVVHFDHWWNPAVMRQAEDRVHRKGQKAKTVNIYEFWMADTIDERIFNLLKEKQLLSERLIDSLASPSELEDKVSTAELLGLFDLKMQKDGSIVEISEQTHRSKSTASLSLKEIVEQTKKLTPEEFEKFIGRVIPKMGYSNVEHKGKQSDGGVDVLAWRNVDNRIEHAYIQCKRYIGIVGVKEVRDLQGVVSLEENQDIGILVTTGNFTSQCKQFAARTNGKIKLIDGMQLARKIKEFGIEL